MTITSLFSTTNALPDAFSAALMQIVDTVQPSIVQVRNSGRGAGTGIIWHPGDVVAGLAPAIITNHHVVASEKSKIHVQLTDGRVLDAQVIDSDSTLDLALLKVTASGLKAIPTGDSSKLRVGELVFAIGHPWGRRGVVTAGIVSNLGTVRFYRSERTAQYIKSDVRLAPGNSGGPLLDAQGTVIGVNAMIFGGDLSVAIPSNVVSTWIAGLSDRLNGSGKNERPLERSA